MEADVAAAAMIHRDPCLHASEREIGVSALHCTAFNSQATTNSVFTCHLAHKQLLTKLRATYPTWEAFTSITIHVTTNVSRSTLKTAC